MDHCKYGPSALPAINACRLFEPTFAPTPEAQAGTDAHANLEAVLEGMADAESPAVEWAARDIQEARTGGGREKWYFEKRLTASPRLPESMQGWFGTADVVAIDEEHKRILIFDFKTFSRCCYDGWYMPQLKGYAALAFGEFAPADDTPDEWVVYLRVLHGGNCTPETYACLGDECVNEAAALLADKQTVVELGSDDGLYKPCVNMACKYCARASKCPALSRSLSTVDFGGNVAPAAWFAMSLPQKVAFIRKVKPLFDLAEKEAKEACRKSPDGTVTDEDGRAVRLIRKRGAVQLPNAATLLESVEKYGVDASALLGVGNVTKGALVGLLVAANTDGNLKKKDFENFVDTLGVVGKDREELVLE